MTTAITFFVARVVSHFYINVVVKVIEKKDV